MNHLLPHPILALPATSAPRAFQAVTLFLDISGFTPLTEALMQQGKHGAEVLAEVINATFRPVIMAIYAHGGYISGFAGDAITAIFEATRDEEHENKEKNLEEAARRAISAAWHIRGMFEEKIVRTPTSGFPLAAKIGMDLGMLECGLLGAETRQAYYYRGPAIDGCARAEHYCRQGEIVLSANLCLQVGAEMEPIEAGFGRLLKWAEAPMPPVIFPTFPLEAALRFYSREVLEMPNAGEFRQLVCLFVCFDDFSLSELDDFTRQVLHEVETRSGYFNRLDFGDKGRNCLVFFGAPTAHENDLTRALQVALSMREKYGQGVRISLSTGQMYFGRVGIPERCEIAAFGSRLNLAARLMVKAQWGQILTTQHVAQTPGFVFTRLGEFPYKGFAAPVPTYQLERAKTAYETFFSTPMAGRSQELQRLLAAAEQVLTGHAAAALIYGDPGMGKSRLAFALRETLGERVTWLRGQTDSILRQAFNPFTYILQQYFEQNPEAPPEENCARFEARLESLLAVSQSEVQRAELLRTQSFLGALLNLHWPGSLYAQLDSAGLRYENTLSAIRAFLLALSAARPLVLEIEDGHWLDEASRELLTRLTRQTGGHPLLLVISSRYADDGGMPAFSIEEWPVTQVELRQLQPQALHDLVTQQLGGEADEALFGFLETRSQGVPFFAQQLVLYLQETGALEQQEQRWHLRIETSDLPASLNAMLIARLDRLSAQVKQAVQTAAVLGREFDVRLLSQMLRLDATDMVQAAEQEQIWTSLNEIRYLFKHALLRDAAYEMQLRARLRALHQLALEAYEQIYAADLRPHYDELAYHAAQSDDKDRQREYFRKAGEAAQAGYRSAAALDYYVRLLPLLAEIGARLDIHLQCGAILELIGDWKEAAAEYQVALRLAEQAQDMAARARCQKALGVLARQRDDYDGALHWLEQARAAWETLGDLDGVNQTMLEIGILYWRQGQPAKARQSLEDGLALARQLDDQRSAAAAINSLGNMAWSQGDYTTAEGFYTQSLALQQALGDKLGAGNALLNLGNVARYRGDYAAARALYERSLPLFEEIGHKRGIGAIIYNWGNLAVLQGDPATAKVFYEKALALYKVMGFKAGINDTLVKLGTLALDQGNYAAAQTIYEDVLADIEENGNKPNLAFIWSQLGEVALARGDYAAAQKLFQDSLPIFYAMQNKLGLAYDCLGVAAIAGLTASSPGAAQHAIHLAAAAESLFAALNTAIDLGFRQRSTPGIEAARKYLGEAAWAAAWTEGEKLTLEELVQLAMEEIEGVWLAKLTRR